jgi:hypothetical protein
MESPRIAAIAAVVYVAELAGVVPSPTALDDACTPRHRFDADTTTPKRNAKVAP